MPEVFYDPEKMLDKSYRYALAGASSAWNDHAYHLLLAMEKAGYTVIPLHPVENSICNIPAYPSITTIFPAVDVVIFASKDEELSLKYLREMRDFAVYKAWFEEDHWTHPMEVFATEHFFEAVKGYSLFKMVQAQIPAEREEESPVGKE
ncbi:MAG: CoA-binding protein [Candidatus Peregrinibacteria bacterium]